MATSRSSLGQASPLHPDSSVTRPAPRLSQPRSGGPAEAARLIPMHGKVRLCRYFGTASGCRAGESCPFLHDPSRIPTDIQNLGSQSHGTPGASVMAAQASNEQTSNRTQAVTKPPQARVVSKPVPESQTQNPREYQLGQIRRRFNPRETKLTGHSGSEDATVLNFNMAPSDPDFPFDMDKLQCSLIVPESYPGSDSLSQPRLKVTNKDIPRGFTINIEKGFDGLVEERKVTTLLALLSALDKNLEKFLSEKKAETIKLVANADKRHLADLPVRAVNTPSEKPTEKVGNVNFATDEVRSKPMEYFTEAQKAEALQRRESETRQLEARLGRLPLYKKSGDGIAYTIPIDPRKRSELPTPLQAIKTVQLFVPSLYHLYCCRIRLEGIGTEDAEGTEVAFEEHAKKSKEMTLMGHVNYLVQNLHILAKNIPRPRTSGEGSVAADQGATSAPLNLQKTLPVLQEDDDNRSHIVVIPRPPEWTMDDTNDLSDSEDDYSYDSEVESGDGGIELEHSEPQTIQTPEANPEKGTALSFPFIELYGIELLEMNNLNLTVKCIRCKDATDVHNLKTDKPQITSCRKCAAVLKVGFRRDLIHANSIRAGFLDLEGCTTVDMLPSSFVPTCSNCSTAYPLPGIISVQGETTTNTCRECYKKLTFSIPSVKFLRITSSAQTTSSGPRRKRETLGLVTGTELPDHGRCRHYAKSYRWFRFSCCDKVFPCDKCHDEKEEHPNEHGNRMICGWCSREQVYRPEECAFCGKGVVARKGRGFWEGGKGTRDKVRMSKKDPRKYKRIGGDSKEKA